MPETTSFPVGSCVRYYHSNVPPHRESMSEFDEHIGVVVEGGSVTSMTGFVRVSFVKPYRTSFFCRPDSLSLEEPRPQTYRWDVGTYLIYHHNLKPDHVREMSAIDGLCGRVTNRTIIQDHPHYYLRFDDYPRSWWCREDSLTPLKTITISQKRKEL